MSEEFKKFLKYLSAILYVFALYALPFVMIEYFVPEARKNESAGAVGLGFVAVAILHLVVYPVLIFVTYLAIRLLKKKSALKYVVCASLVYSVLLSILILK